MVLPVAVEALVLSKPSKVEAMDFKGFTGEGTEEEA
jgi:hypothetical protein